MARFIKKPVEVEAVQWFEQGDHPIVFIYCLWDETLCKHCATMIHFHGWIDTLEGGHIVCPEDWIITGIKGEHYPCKPDIFAATYDRVIEPPASVEQQQNCPHCGPVCYGGAAHSARAEDGVFYPKRDDEGREC